MIAGVRLRISPDSGSCRKEMVILSLLLISFSDHSSVLRSEIVVDINFGLHCVFPFLSFFLYLCIRELSVRGTASDDFFGGSMEAGSDIFHRIGEQDPRSFFYVEASRIEVLTNEKIYSPSVLFPMPEGEKGRKHL